jgi:TRAP-type mannitol/chloroaromatic compound transport system permease small subunit
MHQRVFVYGTLLQGQVNHRLLAGAVCLGPHSTAPVFTLFNLVLGALLVLVTFTPLLLLQGVAELIRRVAALRGEIALDLSYEKPLQ